MLDVLIAYRHATVGENPSAKGRLPFDFVSGWDIRSGGCAALHRQLCTSRPTGLGKNQVKNKVCLAQLLNKKLNRYN
jgi:hypothetical protein